ncbi:MAG: HNH endonuclease, partial [Actinomycetia bacterium]|nr:HNH endonuclease [Actinomycetes bacterium]
VPASIARTLAADPDATWRRLVTDEIGHLIDAGRDSYRPPASLRRHVVNRHTRCVFPGCARRATGCDIDHTTAWEDGGTTSAANLLPLCRRHHHFKHEAGWKLQLTAAGAARWTSPTGQIYWTWPTVHPIDQTTDFDASDLATAGHETPDLPVAGSTGNSPTHAAKIQTGAPATADPPVAGSPSNRSDTPPGPARPARRRARIVKSTSNPPVSRSVTWTRPAPAPITTPDPDDPPPF